MLLYFDESGDFAFPDDRFDAYTQAVLIYALPVVEEYVEGQKAAWGGEEPHATELDDGRAWVERCATESGNIDLRVLFEHGLEFESSHGHAGLQLADVVAYVTSRKVRARFHPTVS